MMEHRSHRGRVLVASNRLPIVLDRSAGGELRITRGSGGLVSALLPVLAGCGGRWVGWLGGASDEADAPDAGPALATVERELGCQLHRVGLTRDEIDAYYRGFSNEVLWPLFHDQLNRCQFDPRYWAAYQQVNAKFAQVVAAASDTDDLVWIHDYHLMRVAAALREAGVRRRTAFFLHIPVPAPDLLASLPWHAALLDGLLAHDLVGFQTQRDLDNFLAAVRRLSGERDVGGRAPVRAMKIEGHGLGPQGDPIWRVHHVRGGVPATTTAAALPISVDFHGLVTEASQPEVEAASARVREQLDGRRLILGVDRLDYSKGIPERLAAYDRLLERHPELLRRVTMLQVVVPSRVEIPDYQALEREVQRRVGEILGKHWLPGWAAIEYAYRSLAPAELLGLYRAADVALVTPLKDGMNLVCKEYCAAQLDDRGVLVLSEFAGAAAQLGRDSLLVNPHDVDGMATALYEALMMPAGARELRMRALRSSIEREDIFAWVQRFFALWPAATSSRWPSRRSPSAQWPKRPAPDAMTGAAVGS